MLIGKVIMQPGDKLVSVTGIEFPMMGHTSMCQSTAKMMEEL